jgi:hypothetical protein
MASAKKTAAKKPRLAKKRRAPEARGTFEQKVLARAASDPKFRQALVRDPQGTLEKALKIKLPANVKINVLEESLDQMYLVLPMVVSKPTARAAMSALVNVGGCDGNCTNTATGAWTKCPSPPC